MLQMVTVSDRAFLRGEGPFYMDPNHRPAHVQNQISWKLALVNVVKLLPPFHAKPVNTKMQEKSLSK